MRQPVRHRIVPLFVFLSSLIPVSAHSQAIVTVSSSQSQATSFQLSQPFTDRMAEFPSLWQKDPRAGFPGDGSKFCMPVAASNALMWLVDHGYPNLLPDPSAPRISQVERETQQIALVKAITVSPYAAMKEDHGASAGWIARGVERYIKDRGYAVDQIDWRPVVAPALAGTAAAQSKPRSFTLDEIKNALRTGAVVWVEIGRYKPDVGIADTYERTSGHGLTLVGYGLDESGRPDPNVLIVHDPAKHRTDATWPNNRWHIGIMGSGHWAGKEAATNKPGKSMAGRYVIISQEGKGLKDGRFSLLENATVLRMRPVTASTPH